MGALNGILFDAPAFPPELPSPHLTPCQTSLKQDLLLLLHSLNLFEGSMVTIRARHEKGFGIPLDCFSLLQLLLLLPSVIPPTSHFQHPHSPRTICSFPVHYLLPCLCAHSSLCLEFPFPPGASSVSSIHSTRRTSMFRDKPGTRHSASRGDTVHEAANYGPSLVHHRRGWGGEEQSASYQINRTLKIGSGVGRLGGSVENK